MLKAKVHRADITDRDGVMLLVDGAPEQFPRLHHIWLDAGYNGKGKGKDWLENGLGWTVKMVRHPPKSRGVWVPPGVGLTGRRSCLRPASVCYRVDGSLNALFPGSGKIDT